MILPVSAGFDRPSPFDLDSSLIEFGGSSGMTDLVPPNKKRIGLGMTIRNQSKSPLTKMGCGSFACVHGENGMRIESGFDVEVNAPDHWEAFIEAYKDEARYIGLDIRKDGSYLQDQVGFLKVKEYVSGYYKTQLLEQMIDALAINRAIVTGSKYIDRKETRRTGRATRGSGFAHLFCIVGYDKEKECFIAVNSYGVEAYDNGYFYIKFSDIDLLYTRYALVDRKEKAQMSQVLMNYKLSISIIGHRARQGENISEGIEKASHEGHENHKYYKYFLHLQNNGAIEEIVRKSVVV